MRAVTVQECKKITTSITEPPEYVKLERERGKEFQEAIVGGRYQPAV